MTAGENPGVLVATMHSCLAGQAVSDRQAVATAVQRLDQVGVGVGPVGYCGTSTGCGLGIPLIASEPRIRTAVPGLLGVHTLADDAARTTVPVLFLVQWDDQTASRDQSPALVDALASAEKTLHASPTTRKCRRSKWAARCGSSPGIWADTRSQCSDAPAGTRSGRRVRPRLSGMAEREQVDLDVGDLAG